MLCLSRPIRSLVSFLGLALAVSLAQAPTGNIVGVVRDETGAVVPGAKITITNKETGLTRATASLVDGAYIAASLPAGSYEVKAEAKGFRALVRPATVETGSTTTVDMAMQVGATTDIVIVQDSPPLITYDSHKIDGVINRQQIENLPLNGRSFLQLAFLEPGVTVSPGRQSQYNSQFDVSVLGGSTSRASITVDGGNVRNAIEGNTGQNFSQEVVQEFQISTVNFDLSTGITSVGAVNIVTRSGGNDFHGSGYFFFRDHNMAANPGLGRDPINPDPFFARRQSGFWAGGPIKKDRLFFFTNYEHNNQKGVVTFKPTGSRLFDAFTQIAPTPYTGNQVSTRFDYRVSAKHNLFLRYSHDGNRAFGPAANVSLPSNWVVNRNWADQSILGLTSTVSAAAVNDFRFSYWYWNNRNLFPTSADCPGDCIGLGFPQMTVFGTNIAFGNTSNATQGRDLRRYITSDHFTWQKSSHRLRWGGEWEFAPGTGFWGFADPAAGVVYSPEIVLGYNAQVPEALRIPIPSSFRTIQDLLKLPLAGVQFGIGDPSQPPPFQIDNADHNHRFHLYMQDTWRVGPKLTVNYGLAWQYESALVNHDLSKPQYLAPILGPGWLEPTRHRAFNFSPAAGFAWNVSSDSKTVIRGGAGIYYDTQLLWQRLRERGLLGPVGNGRIPVPGSAVPNPIPGIPGVPVGRAIDFQTVPTAFTLGHLMSIMGPVRAGLERQLANPNPNDLSVRNIELFKSGDNLIPGYYPTSYSEHLNVGVQREIRSDLVLSADFVFRQFMHELIDSLDYNHYNSVRGPAIRKCSGAESGNPSAQCSTGPITVWTPGGRSHYKGLLVKVDKRFSHRYQFTGSYALASRYGLNGVSNLDNWFETWGPQGSRHTLNVSGIVELPWKFQASFISSIATRGPLMPSIPGIDLTGSGLNNAPLPGAGYNQFGRSLGKDDLRRLVNDFNQNYAYPKDGIPPRTGRGQLIPTLRLPENFEFGKNFYSQDLRLSKIFQYRERYKLTVFGEVFNMFNIANLGGYSFNLRDPGTFGQPSTRIGQIFGSGGPRAFQAGGRFTF